MGSNPTELSHFWAEDFKNAPKKKVSFYDIGWDQQDKDSNFQEMHLGLFLDTLLLMVSCL